MSSLKPSAWNSVRWVNTIFLVSITIATLVGAPLYIYFAGLNAFQIGLFAAFFAATGFSITLGYHRLFSHRSFQAAWPVRLFTLLFGAAAFENSALWWCADHRRHHKHVDHDDDPYNITKGFFHAHIGWILFRTSPDSPLDLVNDLQQDRLAVWQHRFYIPIAIVVSFALPALLGWFYEGWIGALGGFLIAGAARVFFVHHMTFCINSLCHSLGHQPYSSRCTARDSGLMALFTFGEGYHNFHHEFQHDYRNGVKAWQFDPTKWTIWLLHKLGLVSNLRRVPSEKILFNEAAEQQRRLAAHLDARPGLLAESLHHVLESAQQRLHQASIHWETHLESYRKAKDKKMAASRERIAELRRELREASRRFRTAFHDWQHAHSLVMAQLAAC